MNAIADLNPGTEVLENEELVNIQLNARITKLVTELEALYREHPTHPELQRFSQVFPSKQETTTKSLMKGKNMLTREQQFNNQRILAEVSAEFEQKKELRLLKSRIDESPLGPGWHNAVGERINKAIQAGVLHPNALMQFAVNPIPLLREIPYEIRRQFSIPDVEEAQIAIAKSLSLGHDGR